MSEEVKSKLDPEGLVRDLVEISLSAQKVLGVGNFPISIYGEISTLAAMTNYIIDTYTSVKEKDGNKEESSQTEA